MVYLCLSLLSSLDPGLEGVQVASADKVALLQGAEIEAE